MAFIADITTQDPKNVIKINKDNTEYYILQKNVDYKIRMMNGTDYEGYGLLQINSIDVGMWCIKAKSGIEIPLKFSPNDVLINIIFYYHPEYSISAVPFGTYEREKETRNSLKTVDNERKQLAKRIKNKVFAYKMKDKIRLEYNHDKLLDARRGTINITMVVINNKEKRIQPILLYPNEKIIKRLSTPSYVLN